VIDEMADLMSTSQSMSVEDANLPGDRMASAGRHSLIHRDTAASVDVITGVIKANIPLASLCRRLPGVDSRTMPGNWVARETVGIGDNALLPPKASPEGLWFKARSCLNGSGKVLSFIKTNHADGYDTAITEAI
jgi:S-DNA-T family DNA segregation ATPase FtsK/SpoIIIE